MSLARQTREHVASLIAASAPALEGGLTPADITPEDAPYTSAAVIQTQQVALRLQHDLRRLKDIKSVANKIAAKRVMLPEYGAWIDGQLAAGAAGPVALTGTLADEVVPTILVWAIDIAAWPLALQLAQHVLAHQVPLPARYVRDAPTLILEEIAEAALRAQNAGQGFPLAVLDRVEELVHGIDMHDQPRAKFLKAIGIELERAALAATGDSARPMVATALARLDAAEALDPRIGVKGRIKSLRKALVALTPAADADPATEGSPPPTEIHGTPPATDTAGTPPAA